MEAEKEEKDSEARRIRQETAARNRQVIEYAKEWPILWGKLIYGIGKLPPNSPVMEVKIPMSPEEYPLMERLLKGHKVGVPHRMKTVRINPAIAERIIAIGRFLSQEAKRLNVQTLGVDAVIVAPVKAMKRDRNLAIMEIGRLKSRAEL
jgi:hypothetical protein